MEKARFLIISIDALVYEDLEYFCEQPHFQSFFKESCRVNRMKTTYPSMTYTAHTSIISGVHPDKHGISHNEVYNNEINQLNNGTPAIWEWYADALRTPTLFDYAMRAGYKIGNSYWPVQACGNIDYNIPEIWPLYSNEDPRPVFEKAGAAPIMETIFENNREFWDWRNHPGVDIFSMKCAVDIIKTYKPEFMTIHVANIDAIRHSKGVFSNYVKKEIELTDTMLGEIFEALKSAGIYENTNIVILGDHGQLDVHKNVCINVLFEKVGLIDLDKDGNIISYDAFCKSAGLSAHIMLADPQDKKLFDRVHKMLKEWKQEPKYGIGEVFTNKEVKEKHHLSGPFSFVLETDGSTSFGQSVVGPIVRDTSNGDYKFSTASHGHLPTKGPQPPLIVKGPAFKTGVIIESGDVVDVAPTIAKAMGICMENVDGKILYELLKDV